MSIQALYEHKALLHAEKYGILDYKVIHGKMIYYANYPTYLNEKRKTYKVVVNLSDMTEERTQLKRWNKKGNANMYL